MIRSGIFRVRAHLRRFDYVSITGLPAKWQIKIGAPWRWTDDTAIKHNCKLIDKTEHNYRTIGYPDKRCVGETRESNLVYYIYTVPIQNICIRPTLYIHSAPTFEKRLICQPPINIHIMYIAIDRISHSNCVCARIGHPIRINQKRLCWPFITMFDGHGIQMINLKSNFLDIIVLYLQSHPNEVWNKKILITVFDNCDSVIKLQAKIRSFLFKYSIGNINYQNINKN